MSEDQSVTSMIRERYKFLDGETLFRQFYVIMGTAGSVLKLVEWCRTEGHINPRTGKAPTPMGVYQSMWRWAVKNPSLARPMFAEYIKSLGKFLSSDMWYETLNIRARAYLTYRGYEKFLSKNPTARKYDSK